MLSETIVQPLIFYLQGVSISSTHVNLFVILRPHTAPYTEQFDISIQMYIPIWVNESENKRTMKP